MEETVLFPRKESTAQIRKQHSQTLKCTMVINSHRFNSSTTADQVLEGKDLTGNYFVVTGSSGGIGEDTARTLFNHGATVVMASRSMEKLKEAERRIKNQHPNSRGQLYLEKLDLASLKSIDDFSKRYHERYPKLNVLINNAGQLVPSLSYTEDGFETHMGVNYMGHFALTLKLLDIMKTTSERDNKEGRVINVSSMGHRLSHIHFDDMHYKNRSYSKWRAYGQSKVANILFTKELNRRLRESNVNITSNSLHPGNIKTDILRNSTDWITKVAISLLTLTFKNIAQGAATQVYLATSDDLNGKGGLYFDNCKEKNPSHHARDAIVAAELFTLSEEVTNTKYPF